MKLEEIVGYYPHDLRLYDTDDLCEMSDILDIGDLERIMQGDERYGTIFKPILKTELSEQEKHILGGLVNPYDSGNLVLLAEGFIEGYGADGCAMPEAIKAIQYLYSIHYDIHGLVERGEAIDIKTLKDE